VRWNDLFSDLEGQLAAAHASEFELGVRDLTEAERATVLLAERLTASASAAVTLTLRGGTHVSGVVSDVTAAWVLLAEGGREKLVPLGAIAMARGVGNRASSLGTVAARLGLGHALRALARDRAVVTVITSGGELRGRVGQVGSDHLDVNAPDGSAVAIPFAEILAVASEGQGTPA